jgi:hypothetical protein
MEPRGNVTRYTNKVSYYCEDKGINSIRNSHPNSFIQDWVTYLPSSSFLTEFLIRSLDSSMRCFSHQDFNLPKKPVTDKSIISM